MRRIPKKNNWLKSISEALNLTNHGYVVDKRIFRGCIAVMLILFGVVMVEAGQNNTGIYVSCPADVPMCRNPLFDSGNKVCDKPEYQFFCNQEFIPGGLEYGQKPSWLAQNLVWLILGLVALSVVSNHLIYNRRLKK